MDTKPEKNRGTNKNSHRQYFTMVPHMVWLKARSPYDVMAWITIMNLAGDEGEHCEESTNDLAALSLMSLGKFSDCRAYLIEQGLLEGQIETVTSGQNKWHLIVPDLWEENIKLSKQLCTNDKKIKFNNKYRLSDTKKLSPHESKKLSPHESKLSPHESKLSPHESSSFIDKNILKTESLKQWEIEGHTFENLLLFWNQLGVYDHGFIAPTDRGKSFVTATIERLEEAAMMDTVSRWNRIRDAMQTYADLYHSPDHKVSWAWTATEFLNRGFSSFTDREVAFKNYRNSNFKSDRKNFYEQQSERIRTVNAELEAAGLVKGVDY